MKIDSAKLKKPTSKLDPIRTFGDSNKVITVFNEDKKGEFYYIKIEDLLPYHKQARRHFDENKIKELATTIKEHGVRQPLTVIKSLVQPEKYEIISGERRFRAAQSISLEKVPCIILNDDTRADEIALIENIQREDLHPIELGIAYYELMAKKDSSSKELADMLGTSWSSVKEHLQYRFLEENIKNLLISNKIQERRVLRKVMSLKTEASKLKYVEAEIAKRVSNIGKKYASRKTNLLTIAVSNGKMIFELKDLSRLTEIQQNEFKNFIATAMKKVEKSY